MRKSVLIKTTNSAGMPAREYNSPAWGDAIFYVHFENHDSTRGTRHEQETGSEPMGSIRIQG